MRELEIIILKENLGWSVIIKEADFQASVGYFNTKEEAEEAARILIEGMIE